MACTAITPGVGAGRPPLRAPGQQLSLRGIPKCASSVYRCTRKAPCGGEPHVGRRAPGAVRRRTGLDITTQAAPGGPGGPNAPLTDRQQRRFDQQIVVGVGVGLTVLVVLALRYGGGALDVVGDGFDLGAGTDGGDFAFGAGDCVGAAFWAVALYYCSPWQLLFLFFGTFDTERPSDWLLRGMGTAAGQDVDAIDYQAPAALQAATLAFFGGVGVAVAAACQGLLGDATWSVSTGLGSLMGAGMYEMGRPRRLNVDEAQALEALWQDFRGFADVSLQRRGQCHESEILRAMGRQLPRYRAERALDSNTLRDLVRNWCPDADRTTNGFYKGVSLIPAGQAGSGSSSSSSSLDQL